MATDTDQTVWMVAATVIGTIIGGIGTALGHFFTGRTSMAAIIDGRTRTLFEGYERRIDDLQEDVRHLEAKVDFLTKELTLAREHLLKSGSREDKLP